MAPNAPLNFGVNGLYKNGQFGIGGTWKGAFNTDGVVSPHYTLDGGYYLNGKRKFDFSVGGGVLFNFNDNVGLDLGAQGTLGFAKSAKAVSSSVVNIPEEKLTIINKKTVIDPPMLVDAKGYADLRFKFGDKNPFILTGGVVAGKVNMPEGTKAVAQADSRAVNYITGEVKETHESTIMNPENTNKFVVGPRLGIEKSFGNFYLGANAEYLPQLKSNPVNAGVTLGLRF